MSGADPSCVSCAALKEELSEVRSQLDDAGGFNNHMMLELLAVRSQLRERDNLISRLTLELADKTLERLNDA